MLPLHADALWRDDRVGWMNSLFEPERQSAATVGTWELEQSTRR